MSRKETVEQKLRSALSPESLAVIDESHLHAGHGHGEDGHAAFNGSGETHFRIRIVAAGFAGKTRIERHRQINAALAEELAAGLHALAIEANAPGEPSRR